MLDGTAPVARLGYATGAGKVKEYLVHAKMGAKLWKEHGALGYTECVGEDLRVPYGLGFPRMAAIMDETNMPFDPKRFAMGGFEVLVGW